MNESERFWTKVQKTDDCWLWTASLSGGYGQFWAGGRRWRAHRYMWIAVLGREVPDGSVLNHLCRVRHCVSPEHLEVVTPLENVQYSARFVTHCPVGHEYTEANTYIATSSGRRPFRMCRPCHAERERIRKSVRLALPAQAGHP